MSEAFLSVRNDGTNHVCNAVDGSVGCRACNAGVPAPTDPPLELVLSRKTTLIFDGDGAQYLSSGDPCSLCGCRQTPWGKPRAFIRVRRKVNPGASKQVAQLCPDCIARAVLQVERLSLWSEVSPAVRAAVKRMINKRRRVAVRKVRP